MPRRLTFAALFLCLASLTATPAASAVIVLDGLRDPSYVLLSTDPVGDIPASLMLIPATEWADLTALYAYTTTTDLYIYIALPAYARDRSSGQIGLAIETTGDMPNAGGPFDPWANLITYAYTSTHNLTGTVPHTTTYTLLPDLVIRSNLVGIGPGMDADENDGKTHLYAWNGAAWEGGTVNWGGIDPVESESPIGTHIAYADGHGVELAIPLSDLGVSVSATLHLQAFSTQLGEWHGAYDTVPSDVPATSPFSATVQHTLATLVVPSAPEPAGPPAMALSAAAYQVGESDGHAVITLVSTGAVTQPITGTVHALPGTASSLDFVPLTATLTLSPATTSRPFTVTLLDDDLDEPNETILLDLAVPINANLTPPTTAILTISDDDEPLALLWRILLPFLAR